MKPLSDWSDADLYKVIDIVHELAVEFDAAHYSCTLRDVWDRAANELNTRHAAEKD